MRRRQGFTLVELLVSMALIIFIMAILSQAFAAAMGTFRNLKALGDMAEKLRAATQLLTRDLSADHFEGKKRLSDPNFWLNGPPQQGYFQIYQGSVDTLEGNVTDPSVIGSYYCVTDSLAFTVKLRGNQMGDFFSASGGMAALSGLFGPSETRYQATSNGAYNYQWAAVAWFLQPTGSTTVGGIPLYTLYRRQALLVPDNNLVQPVQSYINQAQYNALIANYQEMSCWGNPLSVPPGSTPGSLYFNSPIDITDPQRRFWGGVAPYTPIAQGQGTLSGSDIQLTDVVSFDVRVLVPGVPNATTPNDPFVSLWQTPFITLNPNNVGGQNGGMNNGNPVYYPVNASGPMVFDTWTSLNDGLGAAFTLWNSPGLPLPSQGNPNPPPNPAAIPLWNGATGPSIQAIQISIRIWDYKTNQTRQVTIVQAM